VLGTLLDSDAGTATGAGEELAMADGALQPAPQTQLAGNLDPGVVDAKEVSHTADTPCWGLRMEDRNP
jgi:hypothetical protein